VTISPPEAREGWTDLLHACGLKATPSRLAVLVALHELGQASSEEVHRRAEQSLPGLSLSTVYRLLEVLAGNRVVCHTHLDNTKHFRLVGTAARAHVICRVCGEVRVISEAAGDLIVQQLATEVGFLADLGHLTVHGCCTSCA
jgi:Fur family ferric uptake transcriptional regulator